MDRRIGERKQQAEDRPMLLIASKLFVAEEQTLRCDGEIFGMTLRGGG